MTNISDRLIFLKGTPYEAGYSLGRKLGKRLEETIERYIRTGPGKQGDIDPRKLADAVPRWLEALPARFREEIEGIADGSGVSVRRYAEWYCAEHILPSACTGVIVRRGGHTWIARNNDYLAPDMWGYASVHNVSGRIPFLGFGLEGSLFTITGMNREKLYLHHNYLPVSDSPRPGVPHLPFYVWLTEALETCRTISDVERLLNSVDRDEGMFLFAVEGATEEAAVFECGCSAYRRREPEGGVLIGTNHYLTDIGAGVPNQDTERSVSRYHRVEELAAALPERKEEREIRRDLQGILADDGVEARGEEYFTVYSCVACPGTGSVWSTFGGFPAAEKGYWHKLPVLW